MAETRSSSFSLSSSNTDWWNSSRGVPCRSRKGRADCSEGSRTPFSVCQHKRGNRCGQQVTAGAAKRNSNKKKGAESAQSKAQTPPAAFSPQNKAQAPPAAFSRRGLHGDPPHLELLDGLQRLRAVGQRLLEILAVGHPQLLQPRVHGSRPPRRARSRRGPPAPGPPARRGPTLAPSVRNSLRQTNVPGSYDLAADPGKEGMRSGNAADITKGDVSEADYLTFLAELFCSRLKQCFKFQMSSLSWKNNLPVMELLFKDPSAINEEQQGQPSRGGTSPRQWPARKDEVSLYPWITREWDIPQTTTKDH